MNKLLYPKCLDSDAEFGNTSRGYLLPCCWWDIPDLFESGIQDLVQEKFRIDVVDSLDDVVNSTEWATFFRNVENNIAPDYCFQICGRPSKMYGIKNEP